MSNKKAPKAKFLKLNLTEAEEEQYLKSKSFFLKLSQETETSIKKINAQILETEKFIRGFEAYSQTIEEGSELANDVANIIKNLRESQEQTNKAIVKLEDKLIICNYIIVSCFTETIEGENAIVQKEGKVFSSYFSRFLNILEG